MKIIIILLKNRKKVKRRIAIIWWCCYYEKNGEIEAIGEIVKVNGKTSPGGGRTKAAISLAKGGIALKISNDGYIECYARKNKNKYYLLFKIGNN